MATFYVAIVMRFKLSAAVKVMAATDDSVSTFDTFMVSESPRD